MASINGISIKGLKNFLGHEGEPLAQGNLYLNNKKLGFWSQDSWGGPDQFHLDDKYSERLLNQAVIAHNPDKAETFGDDHSGKSHTIDYTLEIMLCDYLDLLEDEKAFKSAVKSGYGGILVATDGYHRTTWKLPESYTARSDESLLQVMKEQLDKARSSFYKETDGRKHEIKIYRSLDDFVVGEPIQMEEIMVKKDLDKLLADAGKAAEKGKGAAEKSKDADFNR